MISPGAAEAEAANTQACITRFLDIHESQARSACADLDRLKCLIEDAGERLLASFSVIGEIAEHDSASPAAAQALADAVGNAVSALQFQDMANQLLGHAAKRIEALQRVAAPLRRMPHVAAYEFSDAVEGSAVIRGDGPVAQACMSGGSVDLF